jgi:hypothetical protein
MLSANEMQYIGRETARTLSEDSDVELLRPLSEVEEKIASILSANMEEEKRLNADCDKVMDQYSREIEKGDVDPHKFFVMIKRKLAKERGFVL